MRILFYGTPEFAAVHLRALLGAGHEIGAVVTQPDKPLGRKKIVTPPPVKAAALEAGIPVYQPVRLRDGSFESLVRGIAPELAVVVAYGRLLPAGVLAIPQYETINIHASLLPKYRGAGPIQWAILNGERETGVTSMMVGEELDAGDILLSKATPIGEGETYGELQERLAPLGAQLLLETVSAIESGAARRTPQDASQVSLAPILTKELSPIDFHKPAFLVARQVCGLNPWPVATLPWDERKLRVFRAFVGGETADRPGTARADGDAISVACGDGKTVRLTDVQLELSKRMSAADFLRGHPIEGTRQLL
ncbi:methionyl-tRNA formyltransferase [Feifania hominis]|uniref:Methionyl-tRNA formyltransferase n=1 Tax=Feifania hominis TaxID=2763660 RepID=A0A926DFP6_9FIRM|nr:methionyl-tRNA formyltransferase [Feifania hominis]MBC8536977.1 methionyl-tRNA formyltransferase [Feifania hominis]